MVVERFPLWCLFVVCLLFRVQDQWIDTPDTCGSIIEDYGRLEHSWYSVANDAIQIRFKCFELEHCTRSIIVPYLRHRRILCYFLL